MKIFSSIVSIKTALIALLTCINLVMFWSDGHKFIEGHGIDKESIFFIFIVVCYSVSHVVIICLFKIWNISEKSYLNFKLIQKKSQKLSEFNKNIVNIIPHLPESQIKILSQLKAGEVKLNITIDTLYLERQSYIKQVHEVSRSSAIFEINKVVEKELSKFLSQKRKEYLENYIKDITAEEIKFLNLFFSNKITEGTRESGNYMEHNIYQSGKHLAYKNILVNSSEKLRNSYFELFRIEPEVSELLEKNIFHKKVVHNEFQLDLSFIYSANSSGSGS